MSRDKLLKYIFILSLALSILGSIAVIVLAQTALG